MTSLKAKGKQNPELVGEAEFSKKWEHENDFSFLRKSNDPRFGEITIYKSKVGNDLVFSKEQLSSSKNQASTDIRDLNSRVNLNHENIHRLLGHSHTVQKELCSTNYLTKVFYEFPKSDLHKAIEEKKSKGESFRSDELLNIGNQALKGLNHLHKLEVTHGDIKPLNIGYNKETGKVQILDRLNNPAPLELLQNKNIVENKDLFMSPEVYKRLLGKDKTAKYDPYQNDLYGLGLSLLSAGNGEKLQNLYLPNGEFNQNSLNGHLDKFDAKYANQSPQLSQFVHSLLDANPSERKTAQEYIEHIDNNQDFGNIQTKREVHQVVYAEAQAPVTTYDFTPQTNEHGIKSDTTYHSYIIPDSHNTNYIQAPVQYQKSSNVVYSQAPVTYISDPVVYSQPAQTYVYSKPSGTFESPVTYTTYSDAPNNRIQTKNIVYSQAPPVYENYSRPVEVITNTVYASAPANDEERLVTVQRIDGTSYTYIANDKNDLESHHDYDKHDPRKHGSGQEGSHNLPIQSSNYYTDAPKQTITYVNQGEPVTYVNSAPVVSNVRYVHSAYPGENVVYGSPNNVTYINSGPEVRTYSQQSYIVNEPINQQKSIILNSNPSANVEIRKTYSTPHEAETTVVQTKYVMDGDRVIEVNNQDQN